MLQRLNEDHLSLVRSTSIPSTSVFRLSPSFSVLSLMLLGMKTCSSNKLLGLNKLLFEPGDFLLVVVAQVDLRVHSTVT